MTLSLEKERMRNNMLVEFEFNIGQAVMIDELKCKGVVDMARIGRIREYYVTYWLDGEYKGTWLPYFELSKI